MLDILIIMYTNYTFVCFIFLSSWAIGQPSSISVSDEQKAAFVKIYFQQKQNVLHMDSVLESTIIRNDINQERLKSILIAGFNMDETVLTSQDSLMLTAFKNIQNDINKTRQKNLEKLCKEEKLEVELYNLILHSLKTNRIFQQEIQPFFKSHTEKL